MTIIFAICQFYFDIKPLLYQQTDLFANKSAVISKNISVFKTMDKEKIYFTDKEIKKLKSLSFTKDISKFNSATFKINAYSNKTERVPIFYTDLFFESIPDKYLDVDLEEWKWNTSLDFIPLIIPENYLNLYNFGFAESQGLPVLSKNTISQIEFNLQISGNYKTKNYKSKIIGFSNKLNSILVPEKFLKWANNEFGREKKNNTSRILIEFNNPSDKTILHYFNENNYSINKDKLEFSKLVFFFKSSFIFVFFVAIIIIVLSISFVLLSLKLIIQKNKKLLLNLYNIGYSYKKIAGFYQITISSITLIVIIIALTISNLFRSYYLTKIIDLFDFKENYNRTYLFGFISVVFLITVYNILIIKKIKKTILPNKN